MSKNNKVIYRDAKTGKFVTEDYAKNHPATTVKEENKSIAINKKPKKTQ